MLASSLSDWQRWPAVGNMGGRGAVALQAVEPPAVVSESDQGPFACDIGEATQVKGTKPMALLMIPNIGSTLCFRFP